MSWQWSDAVPYGATDGATLLLNREGIDKLANKPNGAGLIAFLLVHEALHALLGHGWRLAKLPDHNTANIAADYVINAMIANRNKEIGKDVFPLIEGVLLDEQLSGDNSVEQLYRILSKPQQNQDPINPNPKPQQDNDTSNDTNNDDSNDDQDSDQEDNQDLIVGVVVMPTLTSVIVEKICRTLSALAHRIHSSRKPKTARRSKK